MLAQTAQWKIVAHFQQTNAIIEAVYKLVVFEGKQLPNPFKLLSLTTFAENSQSSEYQCNLSY